MIDLSNDCIAGSWAHHGGAKAQSTAHALADARRNILAQKALAEAILEAGLGYTDNEKSELELAKHDAISMFR